jgi:hypothetical protein
LQTVPIVLQWRTGVCAKPRIYSDFRASLNRNNIKPIKFLFTCRWVDRSFCLPCHLVVVYWNQTFVYVLLWFFKDIRFININIPSNEAKRSPPNNQKAPFMMRSKQHHDIPDRIVRQDAGHSFKTFFHVDRESRNISRVARHSETFSTWTALSTVSSMPMLYRYLK